MRRLIVPLLALTLVTAGCRSGAEKQTTRGTGSRTTITVRGSTKSADPVLGALAKTRAEGSARYSLVVAISAAPTTSTTASPASGVELKVHGVWNIRRHAAKSTVQYSTSSGGGGADYIVIDQDVYSGLGAAPGKWQRFDAKSGGVAQDSLGVLRPEPVLDLLAGLNPDPAKIGTEAVDGEETTHYRGTVDLQRAVAAAGRGSHAALKARLDSTAGPTADVELWIDSAGRVRRLVTFTTAKTSNSAIRTTLELSKFGIVANITAPDRADIVATTTTSAPAR